MDSVDIVTEAIATKEANPGCLITLNPTAPDALKLDSDAEITAVGCSVKVNSSSGSAVNALSNSKVTADSICVNGGYSGGSSHYTPTPETGCSKSFDPLKGLVTPTIMGGCTETDYYLSSEDTDVLSPGRYCGGIHLDSDASVTLTAGIYFIEGDGVYNQSDPDFWLSSNSGISGENVTIFLTNGAEIMFDSNSTINLSASKTGPMAGIVIYQDRADAGLGLVHELNSNGVARLEGVVYLPGSTLYSSSDSQIAGDGDPSATPPVPAPAYTMVIADKIELGSSAKLTLNSNYEAAGGVPLPDLLSIAQLRR